MKIALSPSDQFRNPYAAGGTTEKAQMERVVGVAAADLRNSGHTVLICTRGNGQENSYAQHAHEANDWGAELYVAVHSNAGGGHGTEVHVMGATIDPDGYKLGQALLARVGAVSYYPDRGVKVSQQLAEVRIPEAPCALVELTFHDNASEAGEIIRDFRDFGHAVAQACVDIAGGTLRKAPEPGEKATCQVLQLGSEGPAVKDWQSWLMRMYPKSHGKLIADHGGADGDYGYWTAAATASYQRVSKARGNYADAIDGIRAANTLAAARRDGYKGK